jgi:NADPH-dependent ferric siderophore reductase
MTTTPLTVERLRHPLKMRLLRVAATRRLSPHLMAITFTGDDLDDFISASFDDHVKLFFPLPGQREPLMPAPGAVPGDRASEGPRPIARDYTPRRFDRARGELEIQFVLHGDGAGVGGDKERAGGPASRWAAQAQVGDPLGIGGPRGSFVIPTGYDWFWMIGDATALPAIGRRLEELPGGACVSVVLACDEAVDLPTRADVDVRWLPAGADLAAAIAAMALPPGEGYIWAAGESLSMRAVHAQLVGARGWPKERIRASSYWKQGAIATHESLGD